MDYYRKNIVCIDDYREKIPGGRICYSDQEQIICFQGVMEFLQGMEHIQRQSGFTGEESEYRVFSAVKEANIRMEQAEAALKGAAATFVVQIFFRRGQSWQGKILWMEAQREESFRSVMELLWLMDSALSGSGQ